MKENIYILTVSRFQLQELKKRYRSIHQLKQKANNVDAEEEKCSIRANMVPRK